MISLERRRAAAGPSSPKSRSPWRRGRVEAAVAVLVAVLLAGHRLVPGEAGTLLDTALPWLGLTVPVLFLTALARRARLALVTVLAPAVVWSALFGAPFLREPPAGPYDLRAVSQNLYAGNTDPEATAEALVSVRADVVAVQEMRHGTYPRALDRAYDHRVVKGTVGLWSRRPIRDARVVDLGLGWPRALRARVAARQGAVTVYVAHLGSARPGVTAERDATLRKLAGAVQDDRSRRLLVLGDLNTAATDRKLGTLVPPLEEAQRAAGEGFGFTWPAAFPLTRPDHILYRGMDPVNAGTVNTPGTDHRAVRADFDL